MGFGVECIPASEHGRAEDRPEVRFDFSDLDRHGARQREPAAELHELVRGGGVLRVGWGKVADGGGMELRGQRRNRTTVLSVVQSGNIYDSR